VISWVVILALPITLPASIWLWMSNERDQVITSHANIGMLVLGLSSMYLGFIPWYRGLKDAGTARGAQVQQLQVFMTLGWSVILLGESIPPATLICTIGIVISVTWAILSRQRTPLENPAS
jgi:drug/metabolite transporter (DMT)-like permease